MGADEQCAGSGGAPAVLAKDAAFKTGQKHYGKPIWSMKCSMCDKRFNLLSKTDPIPDHKPEHNPRGARPA